MDYELREKIDEQTIGDGAKCECGHQGSFTIETWSTECGGELVQLKCPRCGDVTPSTYLSLEALKLREELDELKNGDASIEEMREKRKEMGEEAVNLTE